MDHYRQNTNNDLQLDAPLEAITRQIQDLFKADSFREVRHALRKMTGQEDSREMAEQPASHKKAFEHWKQQRLDRRSDPNDPSKVVYEIPVHGISNRNAKSPYYYEQLERVSVPQDFDPLTTAAEDIQVSPLGRQKRISKATFDREVGRDAKSAQRINMYTHGVFTSAEGANDVASQLGRE